MVLRLQNGKMASCKLPASIVQRCTMKPLAGLVLGEKPVLATVISTFQLHSAMP